MWDMTTAAHKYRLEALVQKHEAYVEAQKKKVEDNKEKRKKQKEVEREALKSRMEEERMIQGEHERKKEWADHSHHFGQFGKTNLKSDQPSPHVSPPRSSSAPRPGATKGGAKGAKKVRGSIPEGEESAPGAAWYNPMSWI